MEFLIYGMYDIIFFFRNASVTLGLFFSDENCDAMFICFGK